MPKIRFSISAARRLGILSVALSAILPLQAAAPPVLSTLYSFTDLADGGFPEANVTLASTGVVFGTTSSGTSGWGSVFQLVPSQGGASWSEVTLYTFTGGADGANPVADLVIGPSNILYGTTNAGGAHGYGTVFQVAPTGGGHWAQKVLYSFTGGADGGYPASGLALITSGVLYGTTYSGGTAGLGTVFQLVPSASGWTEKVLYSFQGGVDGANPLTDLVVASNGTLYGTTSQGGSVTNSNGTFTNEGTVFKLAPAGGGVWKETVIYTFTGGADGSSPESAVILGPAGSLYGSTFWGGSPTSCPVGSYPQGCGVVYQLTPPTGGGSTWTQTVLHTFTGQLPDGAHPYGNMAVSKGGVIFGTTFSGGANVDLCFPDSFIGCGTIFSVKQTSGVWGKSNLIAFPGSPGAGAPNGLVMAGGGSLYGTSILGGGSGGFGTVFKMTP